MRGKRGNPHTLVFNGIIVIDVLLLFPANKACVFTSSARVNLVENWCKEDFRVLSVFFNR